jgi:hypothetical protein
MKDCKHNLSPVPPVLVHDIVRVFFFVLQVRSSSLKYVAVSVFAKTLPPTHGKPIFGPFLLATTLSTVSRYESSVPIFAPDNLFESATGVAWRLEAREAYNM